MAAYFKSTSAAELCEFEQLETHTYKAPAYDARGQVPRWKRKQDEAVLAADVGGGEPRIRNPNTPSKKSRTPSKRKNIGDSAGNTTATGPSNHAGGEAGPSDRFIPTRTRMDMAQSNFELSQRTHNSENDNAVGGGRGAASSYQKLLAENLGSTNATTAGGGGSGSGLATSDASSGVGNIGRDKGFRILSFRDKAPVCEDQTHGINSVLYTSNRDASSRPLKSARTLRHIPSQPTRILDAPDLKDDYYLNLIAWSANNTIAVALGPAVYLWDAKTGSIDELMVMEDETDYVCSLKWIPGGTHLAVGTATASTQLWDAEGRRQIRSMNGHSDRVSCLAWNDHLLSSGSKDTTIVHHDVRVRDHAVATLAGHEQEVCGLAWSPEGHALASGGNDNKLMIWDAAATTSGRTVRPRFKIGEHCAAVKALAWSPHERNLIASGGGTADRCIKFFNSQTGSMLNSIDTGSQVCSLLWNPHEKEILSSHGFSRNEINLWRYPSMCKVKELTGHTARVLHMAASPDGSSVVSAGADETLRFWDIFGAPPGKEKASAFAMSGFNSMSSIR
jgi:cell division cycle protein 20 (cofactor of APC complex)